MSVGIAFVGCGYVADLYLGTLANWKTTLRLRGVFDKDTQRSAVFSKHHGVPVYPSLEACLEDPSVSVIVNLTNPSAHFEVSKQCLLAGRHVYSEKPLALELPQAEELVVLAKSKNLHLVSAPSSVLGEAAQTLWDAIRRRERGTPRLIYADIDDGLVHRLGYENWQTDSGARWPAKDEFETGCTLEHAGYVLTWLVAMFGSVRRVVSSAQCMIKDKGPDTPANFNTPDFSCAVLEFDGPVVARLTNSIIAPHDHRFRVFCEDGILSIDETWNFDARVRSTPVADTRWRRQAEKKLGWKFSRTLRPLRSRKISTVRYGHNMDFALGIAEMAEAIEAGKTPRLAGDFSLHITEVSLAIQYPDRFGTEYRPRSVAPAVAPMF